MAHHIVKQVASLRVRLVGWSSNAWTRTECEPAAARRLAGLRYWDGDCGS